MELRNSLLMGGLALLAGCATSTPTPVRQAAAPMPASVSTPAATAAPSSAQALTPVVTNADDPRTIATNRYAREMGYKIETRHGVQFYCRSTAPLGSRLAEKQCLTVDGITQAQQIAEQNKSNFQQNQLCQGANCVIK
jgi:hypothetical protein